MICTKSVYCYLYSIAELDYKPNTSLTRVHNIQVTVAVQQCACVLNIQEVKKEKLDNHQEKYIIT